MFLPVKNSKISFLLILQLVFLPILANAQDGESSDEPVDLRESILIDNNGSGTLEIDAYGDSITRGVGDFNAAGPQVFQVDDSAVDGREAGYPLRVESFLGIGVSNRGVPGERLESEGTGRVSRDIRARRPDVALLSGGSNDAIFRISSADIFHSYQTLINVARAVGSNPVLVTLPPACCDRRERNASIIAYNNAIRELAQINSLSLADVNKAFSNTCNVGDCRLLNNPEGLHPNIAGYDVMGETVTASLLNINIFAPDGPEMLEEALNLTPGSITTIPDPQPTEEE